MHVQSELKFDASGPAEGLKSWREERHRARLEMAGKRGLPLDQRVEVWLRGGIRLEGRLCLAEDLLALTDPQKKLTLRVGRTPFDVGEMESCVRLD
jgi:hypothetical protein